MARNPQKFAKETKRDKQQALQAMELQRICDPKTGEIRKQLCKDVSCAVCGNRKSNPIFVKQGFRFVKCPICGLCYGVLTS